jgi:hypothetical protein
MVNRTTKGTALAPQSSERDLYLAAIRRIVRRLASASTRDVFIYINVVSTIYRTLITLMIHYARYIMNKYE